MNNEDCTDGVRGEPEKMDARVELPRYRCHKTVRAMMISSIRHDADGPEVSVGQVASRGGTLVPRGLGISPVKVSGEYMARHRPEAEGYYVVYDDGYESYSPKKAFEEGYSPMTDEAPTDQSS